MPVGPVAAVGIHEGIILVKIVPGAADLLPAPGIAAVLVDVIPVVADLVPAGLELLDHHRDAAAAAAGIVADAEVIGGFAGQLQRDAEIAVGRTVVVLGEERPFGVIEITDRVFVRGGREGVDPGGAGNKFVVHAGAVTDADGVRGADLQRAGDGLRLAARRVLLKRVRGLVADLVVGILGHNKGIFKVFLGLFRRFLGRLLGGLLRRFLRGLFRRFLRGLLRRFLRGFLRGLFRRFLRGFLRGLFRRFLHRFLRRFLRGLLRRFLRRFLNSCGVFCRDFEYFFLRCGFFLDLRVRDGRGRHQRQAHHEAEQQR